MRGARAQWAAAHRPAAKWGRPATHDLEELVLDLALQESAAECVRVSQAQHAAEAHQLHPQGQRLPRPKLRQQLGPDRGRQRPLRKGERGQQREDVD